MEKHSVFSHYLAKLHLGLPWCTGNSMIMIIIPLYAMVIIINLVVVLFVPQYRYPRTDLFEVGGISLLSSLLQPPRGR